MTDIKKNTPEICAITAVGPKNVIGLNGTMPWHSRQDFYHFIKLTTGYPVIFGKNTFFNLPKYPLPKRLNIVCSSAYKNENLGDFVCVPSLEAAFEYCKGFDKLFICGGAGLYKYALDKDYIDTMYFTRLTEPTLSAQIIKNPTEFICFPIDTKVLFSSPKWSCERIFYPPDVLPLEQSDIVVEFFKFTRIR